MMSLSGPSQAPKSGGKPRQLVVLLHGLGADGNDLIGLAPVLGQVLPDAAFVAPNAPFPCDMSPFGYQWLSVQDRTASAQLAGVTLAASILDSFLDEQLEQYAVEPGKLAFVGFSQGTMTSLHVGLRRKTPPACIVGFSGRLIAPEMVAAEATGKPPILLIHGDDDPVVPFANLQDAADGLRTAGMTVETHVCRGLGHGIDEEGLILAAQFLKRTLG